MPPPPTSFHAHYQALVSSGAIEADPAQQHAAEAFAALEQRLDGYTPFSKQDLGVHGCGQQARYVKVCRSVHSGTLFARDECRWIRN